MSSPWWSIPQAIIWVVTRSESQLLRADGARTLAGVERTKGIRPASGWTSLRCPLQQRPMNCCTLGGLGVFGIFGRKWGNEPSRSIARRSDLRLRDYSGEVCLGDSTLYFDTNPFWSNLSVRADDCKRCWPAPAAEKEGTLDRLQPPTALPTAKCSPS